MTQKIILNDVQHAIFQLLSQDKYYSEIAHELNITASEVEENIKAVFCIIAFKSVNKKLVAEQVLTLNLN